MVAAAQNPKDIVVTISGKDLTPAMFKSFKQSAKEFERDYKQIAKSIEQANKQIAEAQKRSAYEALKAEQVVRRARVKEAMETEREIERIHVQGARGRFQNIRTSERLAAFNRNRTASAAEAAAEARRARFASFGRIAGGVAVGAAALETLLPEGARPSNLAGNAIEGISQTLADTFGYLSDSARRLAKSLDEARESARLKSQDDIAAIQGPLRQQLTEAGKGRSLADTLAGAGFISPTRAGILNRLATARTEFSELQRQRSAGSLDVFQAELTAKTLLEERDRRRQQKNDPNLELTEREKREIMIAAAEATDQRWAQLGAALAETRALGVNLTGQSRFQAGIDNLLGGGGIAGRSLLGNILSPAGSAFGRLLGGVSNPFEAFAASRAAGVAGATPAEQLRRALGNIDAQMRIGGLNPAAGRAAQRDLVFNAIGGIDKSLFQAPPLGITESRFLTRGRDADRVPEEMKQLFQKLQEKLHKDNQDLIQAVKDSGIIQIR